MIPFICSFPRFQIYVCLLITERFLSAFVEIEGILVPTGAWTRTPDKGCMRFHAKYLSMSLGGLRCQFSDRSVTISSPRDD